MNRNNSILWIMLMTASLLSYESSVFGGVVFWNKLGSDIETNNSAIGPSLIRQGNVNYEPGVFGNGVRIDNRYPGYFLLNELMIDNLISLQRGTISLWVKTNWPSTDNTYRHIFFDTNMGGGDGRMAMGQWSNQSPGTSTIVSGFFTDRNGGTCESSWPIEINTTYSAKGIDFSANEWHHWAIVFDNRGISGSSDNFRFYMDGQLKLVGNPKCTVNDVIPDQRLNYFGRHNWDGVHADAVFDNLVIYDYAKTDFSDRFNENPLSRGNSVAPAPTTSRLSLTSGGRQAKGDSYTPSVSNDGRYVAFASDATNLVSGDTNGATDIFLLDRVTKQVKLVSKAATPANADSLRPVISGNGRYIAYESYASNLVSGDTNNVSDIFRYDRIAKTTTRISVASGGTQANSDSSQASIADDGNRIAFASDATNLVTGDANAASDIFIRDVTANTTTRASVGTTEGNSDSLTPSLSGNGGFVAFASAATNLVADDTNGRYDIFVRDLAAATTTRVSVGGSVGSQANNDSWQPHISQDGRYVVFASDATNIYSRAGGGSNGVTDIYLRDRVGNVTGWVSRTAAGGQSNEASYNPRVTADGRYVVFESYANLVTEDTNGVADIYLRDRKAVKTILLSASTTGAIGNSESLAAALTADGRYAVFESYATNLVTGDTNLAWDIFVRDRGVGVTPSYPRSLRQAKSIDK